MMSWDQFGIYHLIRIERKELERYVKELKDYGYVSNWKTDKSEKF